MKPKVKDKRVAKDAPSAPRPKVFIPKIFCGIIIRFKIELESIITVAISIAYLKFPDERTCRYGKYWD